MVADYLTSCAHIGRLFNPFHYIGHSNDLRQWLIHDLADSYRTEGGGWENKRTCAVSQGGSYFGFRCKRCCSKLIAVHRLFKSVGIRLEIEEHDLGLPQS